MARTTGKRNLPAQVKAAAKKPIEKRENKKIDSSKLIPSGSTMLNLACSDLTRGAFGLGKTVTLPGSSSSSKTLLILTMFAEVAGLKRFDPYGLFYDDVEEALEFDIARLFGSKMEKRMEAPPNGTSDTIQNFKNNILTLAKKGKPFIYALDSFDSLTSDEELEKEMRKALAAAKSEEAAKKIAGSYNTEKAKIAGQILRMITSVLKETQSTLFIVQQIRQKIGAAPFSNPYTTSGGQAPFFYSTHQVWLTKLSAIKNKGQPIGNEVKAKVTKNKLTGKLREVEFNAFYDYGIDDVGSCVDFLIEEERWPKSKKEKGVIEAGDDLLGIRGTRNSIIQQIEEQGIESKLRRATGQQWNLREEALKLNRKPRFR